jgi:hypothetical protein
MGIHLAAKGLYIEGSLGCHSNSKYSVTAFLMDFDLSVSGFPIQTDKQIAKESCHVLVLESTCDRWHHSAPSFCSFAPKLSSNIHYIRLVFPYWQINCSIFLNMLIANADLLLYTSPICIS